MKKFIIIIGLVVLILGALFILFLNPDKIDPDNPSGKTIYYTVISNQKVEVNNDNRYEYVLTCYDEKGKEKSLSFTTGKKLREEAYVKLYDAPLRGVTYWEEIGEKDLPEKVKDVYKII
nr:YxeA family protein [uncultured Aminipila sp.]